MKKHFFTGLALLLPLILTALIVFFLFNIITKPFMGLVSGVLSGFGWNEQGQFLEITSKILAFVFLTGLVLLVGFLGQLFLTKTFFSLTNKIILKIPIINKIYKAAHDVVHTLFSSKENQFTQVVLVPFPEKGSVSLGLVTNECLPTGTDTTHAGLLSVFVPGTPNPTMGFMLMYRREEVTFVNLKVDEALKIIISCGVISDKIGRR
jgi:uncharacterized membrane protein